MSTKLTVLDALADIVDVLIVGGGIANTFLAAEGHPVGNSLHEGDMLETARALAAGGEGRASIPSIQDVVVGDAISVRRRMQQYVRSTRSKR